MNGNKAAICTTLFTIVLIAMLICTMFIKSYDGSFSLFDLISSFITGKWVKNCADKFFKWIWISE